MIIGRFSESNDGTLVGHIRSMFFKSDKVVFEPSVAAKAANSPAFRVYTADEIELGAAWRKAIKETGLAFFDVKLDDPTFAQPIRCRLVHAKRGDGYLLVWERTKERKIAA
jgi:uncharacterized protein (DUF736 family)